MKQTETLQNRIAQFNLDQKKTATPAPATVATAPVDSQNPYLRARIEVLNKLPAWRKREIAEMEKTGNINNSFYDAFVHEVALLGDKYMPIA